jgi:hypothetical protein
MLRARRAEPLHIYVDPAGDLRTGHISVEQRVVCTDVVHDEIVFRFITSGEGGDLFACGRNGKGESAPLYSRMRASEAVAPLAAKSSSEVWRVCERRTGQTGPLLKPWA